MSDTSERVPALVMGIGNILWADEGFGVRCVEALDAQFEFPAGVELVDGGTEGLYLVNMVTDAERVLVFDALDYGEPPGTVKVVRDAEVPAFAGVPPADLEENDQSSQAELNRRIPGGRALCLAFRQYYRAYHQHKQTN